MDKKKNASIFIKVKVVLIMCIMPFRLSHSPSFIFPLYPLSFRKSIFKQIIFIGQIWIWVNVSCISTYNERILHLFNGTWNRCKTGTWNRCRTEFLFKIFKWPRTYRTQTCSPHGLRQNDDSVVQGETQL